MAATFQFINSVILCVKDIVPPVLRTFNPEPTGLIVGVFV
jgi:hypothetical protein